MKPSVPDTSPTAEKPQFSDEDRAERLALLAARLCDPDGLDHATLAQIEQLTSTEGERGGRRRAAAQRRSIRRRHLGHGGAPRRYQTNCALLEQALLDDRFWITPIVGAHGPEYAALERELNALRVLRNDRAVADAATSAYLELAPRRDGYRRVPLTDALIAPAAAEHGGLAVLHRDAHFERLAEVLAFGSVALPGP